MARNKAIFAKAHNVAYYMSDDNHAAPYIKSIADIAVINYCDLLFMSYSIDNKDIKQLAFFFDAYVSLFPKTPKVLLNKGGCLLDFAEAMAKSRDKFYGNGQLESFLKLFTT